MIKIILILILITPVTVYASTNNCDWKVETLSNNIFENKTDFKFRYLIERIDGNKTNVILIRTIEDVNGNLIKSYDNYSQEITNKHTTPYLSPNLDDGVYLIKGEIFPNCNDIDLENNLESKLIIILPEKFDQNYTKLRINELLPDPMGNDDASMPEGEFIEIYNPGEKTLDLNGLYFKDIKGHKIIIDNTHTTSTIIQPNGFLVVYMNGFSGLLNNDQDTINLYYNDSLIDEVSYSNSREGLSWQKIQNSWKLLNPSPSKENIDEDNFDKGISSIRINKVYTGNDNSVSFGDQFEIRLEIYKGNTSKNVIEAWVEKDNKRISRVTNFNIYGKNSNYTINIPLVLDSNCNNKYEEGTYNLIVEGLNVKDEEKLEVYGFNNNLCNKKVETKSLSKSIATKNNIENEDDSIDNYTGGNKIQGKIIYESSDIKAKNSASYIIIITLTLIIIFILFRKGL